MYLHDMLMIIVLQEKYVTFSIRKGGNICMKLCGLVLLLSLTVMFLNLNQSYAQGPSLNFSDNVTITTIPSLNITSNATTSTTIPSLNLSSNVITSDAVSSLNLPSNATTPTSTYQDFYKHANDLFD